MFNFQDYLKKTTKRQPYFQSDENTSRLRLDLHIKQREVNIIMRNFLFASIDFLDVVFALTSKLGHTLSRKLRATLGMSTLVPSFI